MKMIKAVIKPLKLDEVKEKLVEIGISGITVTEVKGAGRQGKNPEFFLSSHADDLLPKTFIEIAVPNEQAERVVQAIVEAAGTDKIGDGKIFVYEIETAIRIRTGETGENAL